MYLCLVPPMGMLRSFYFLLYVWYRNCAVKIVHITYVSLIDLGRIVLFSYYDKRLLQHTHRDRYLLTIIRLSHNHIFIHIVCTVLCSCIHTWK